MNRLLFAMAAVFMLPYAAVAKSVDWGKLVPELSDAAYVRDDKKCLECHEEYMISYEKTIHAKAFEFNRNPDTPAIIIHGKPIGNTGCENCHGPMSKHLDAPRKRPPLVFSFREQNGVTSQGKNQVCIQCHEKGSIMHWKGSAHEMSETSCSSCHYVMEKRAAKSLFISEDPKAACVMCHKEGRAQLMRSSHMPLREGKMDCAGCHNPHGGPGPSLLKTASGNEACYGCHREKRGPFLWEHSPVREDCLTCHDPHGSNIEYLLKIKVPYLCQTCHAAQSHPSALYSGTDLAGGASAQQLLGKGCLNCHPKVHGSNHPSGARFQR